jgi:DNA-binding transcriptional ArsR family regulator
VSAVFFALADPTRRTILSRLAEGEATVNELAEPFAITSQAVSKHLKVLERAGLVSRGRQAQYRPVRLEPEGFDPAARWLDEHRAMRLAQLDRLEQTIKALRPAPPSHADRPHPQDRPGSST